jgi:transposase
MARRKITMNEIVEVVYQWHQGAGFKAIRRSLGFDRKTIRKYVHLAQQVGVARGKPFPQELELIGRLREVSASQLLRETPAQDLLAPYRQRMVELLNDKEMTAKQVWRLLLEESDLRVSYCTVKRYLRRQFQFGAPSVTVRLEVEPGSQAQVDFGYAALMVDPETGKRRRAWAFVMTLSYSRHRFVRFVFRQDVATWIDCHIRAFAYLNGVPASVVLDNLKSGVIKADIYDPTLNRAYGELERHYGFVADPAKVGLARHKGKVERGVPTVRKHLLAGRSFRDINEANERALRWTREEIGMEIHGTTKRKPFEVFQTEEAAHLKALPSETFECPLWKQCTVHPDHHVVFDCSYYSLPTRFIGRKVWVRGGWQLVKIFLDGELIKTHQRAHRAGTWVTDPSDYPPDKLAYLMRTPSYCRRQAAEIGPETEEFIRRILSQHAMRNLRKAQAILRLAEKYGHERMEAACRRALSFENFQYRSLKRILEEGLDEEQQASCLYEVPLSPLGLRFLRDPTYFASQEEVPL